MVASTEYRELSNFDIQCFTSYHLFGCERQFHGKQSSESILVQDPLSLIAAGAAIGGAAGKFTERAWDVGERWLKRFFLDHAPAANQAARANAARFILELGQCIRKLEDTQLISREAIDNALNNPQFSIILQRAVLGASQTEDAEKSRILAELVTARLTTRPESAFALAVRLACDAVAASNADQLRLLALATALHEIRPRTPLPSRKYHTWLQNLLVPILTPYADEGHHLQRDRGAPFGGSGVRHLCPCVGERLRNGLGDEERPDQGRFRIRLQTIQEQRCGSVSRLHVDGRLRWCESHVCWVGDWRGYS